MKKVLCIIATLFIIVLGGCSSAVQFNKAYLNDPDMKLGPKKSQGVEFSSNNYREGASGANGGSSGGGCGCN